jgi:hypothetical protein
MTSETARTTVVGMIEPYRSDFNARFTQQKYAELLRVLEERTGTKIGFRVAETPCFFAPELMERMIQAGRDLTQQLLGNPRYMLDSDAAVPRKFCIPGQDAHPHFMTVDFGLVRDAAGELRPTLVEMQAFPSLFGYQPMLARAYVDVFDLDPGLKTLLSGLDEGQYWRLLREIVVGDHDPANVVLMEVEPESQKTLPDFRVYEKELGIRTVDAARLIKQGRQLFYRNGRDGSGRDESGALVRVERIFNRVIVDELVRTKIVLPFDYRDDLDVEWAGHPNWYFRVSKFSIPYLDHPAVPAAVFLDEWFAGSGRERLPKDRGNWVLKPLYSFAGKGIQFAPDDGELAAIPEAERHNYLLQERVHFEPVIRTPEGMTQAEIRILYMWPDGGEMTAAVSLVRMGRGLMMGVDQNRDRTWVGGSAGLIPGA